LKKETRSTLCNTCHSANCSPRDAHRTNASLQLIVFRNSLDATSDKTHTCIAKYIADLILYLDGTSSQSIKKQGDYWGQFGQKKMHLMMREIHLIAICRIKLITIKDYSPTNKSLFCLLKLLTHNCESKCNWGTSLIGMR